MHYLIIVVISTLILFSKEALSNTASSGQAQARFLKPLSIVQNQGMNFGVILPDSAGDTVVLSNPDIISSTTGNSSFSGTRHYSLFTLTGEPYNTVTISVPNSFLLTGPGESMEVKDFHINLNQTYNRTLSENGEHVVGYGSSLVINANQAPGTYTGSYAVTVNYQ